MKPLRPQQEIFVREFASGKSAAEAARIAGYSKSYATKAAHLLPKSPAVAARLEQERAKLEVKTTVTLQDSIAEATRLRDWAVSLKNAPAAATFTAQIFKMRGHLVERIQVEERPSLLGVIAEREKRLARPLIDRENATDAVEIARPTEPLTPADWSPFDE